MLELKCTLLGDGSSDEVLEHPIRWLLRDLFPDAAIQLTWADLSRLLRRPKGLANRISEALKLYPASLLFIHRDAERDGYDRRTDEIKAAVTELDEQSRPPYVCVVPVRMTEAWFLFDESAIRQAAGNPNGTALLQLPAMRNVENIPDPKTVLRDLLILASEYGKHRRRRFQANSAKRRLAQVIDDYSPLRNLSAFGAFEAELKEILEEGGLLGK